MSNKVDVYLKCIAFIIFTLVKVCCLLLLGIQPTDWIKSGRNARQHYSLTKTKQRCKAQSTFCKTKPSCLQKLWWGSLTLWYIKPATNTYSLISFLAWIKIKQNQLVDLLASCKNLVGRRKCSRYQTGMRNGHCVDVPVTKRGGLWIKRQARTGGGWGTGCCLVPSRQPTMLKCTLCFLHSGILQPRARAVAVALQQGPEKATDCTGAIREPKQCSGTGFSGRLLTNRLPSGTEQLLEEGKSWNFLRH